jgi:hypothetical protein
LTPCIGVGSALHLHSCTGDARAVVDSKAPPAATGGALSMVRTATPSGTVSAPVIAPTRGCSAQAITQAPSAPHSPVSASCVRAYAIAASASIIATVRLPNCFPR